MGKIIGLILLTMLAACGEGREVFKTSNTKASYVINPEKVGSFYLPAQRVLAIENGVIYTAASLKGALELTKTDMSMLQIQKTATFASIDYAKITDIRKLGAYIFVVTEYSNLFMIDVQALVLVNQVSLPDGNWCVKAMGGDYYAIVDELNESVYFVSSSKMSSFNAEHPATLKLAGVLPYGQFNIEFIVMQAGQAYIFLNDFTDYMEVKSIYEVVQFDLAGNKQIKRSSVPDMLANGYSTTYLVGVSNDLVYFNETGEYWSLIKSYNIKTGEVAFLVLDLAANALLNNKLLAFNPTHGDFSAVSLDGKVEISANISIEDIDAEGVAIAAWYARFSNDFMYVIFKTSVPGSLKINSYRIFR